MSTPSRYVRVPDRHLSLWQSSMAVTLERELMKKRSRITQNTILQHPLMQAVNEHVQKSFDGTLPEAKDFDLTNSHERNVYLSHLHFIHARYVKANNKEMAEATAAAYRPFTDKDPLFECCQLFYYAYDCYCDGTLVYNDCVQNGTVNNSFGVIPYTLPNDAKVAIIGDWGTGMDDAKALLADIVRMHSPDAIIHLGDIYYSGLFEECFSNFSSVISSVYQSLNLPPVPVFTLPGNHDYYDFGVGFYKMLPTLNSSADQLQEASYFCLRTTDGQWQFLGMDTGYNDNDPINVLNPTVTGPSLQPSEATWHTNQLTNFSGGTILLSHHQAFSANLAINGSETEYNGMQYLNPFLFNTFLPFFSTKIAGWLWGHEHNFMKFNDGLFGLAKGRLLGCSAYEEIQSVDEPYTPTYPAVPFDTGVELGTNTDSNGVVYYNHAYGIIDFSNRQPSPAAVAVSYYQFPSWGNTAPAQPISTLLCQEWFSMPAQTTPQPVAYADSVNLIYDDVLFIGQIDSGLECYPLLSPNSPATLQFALVNSSAANMSSGDSIMVVTTQQSDCNALGAFGTTELYYYEQGSEYSDNETWQVQKAGAKKGDPIYYGDLISIYNPSYEQYLIPYWSHLYSDIYLTTSATNAGYWSIQQLPATPSATVNDEKLRRNAKHFNSEYTKRKGLQQR